MGLFNNVSRAIHSSDFGLRLQAALAAANGDQTAIARFREMQRQNAMRDAQVMGAKNLGFSNDEIGALNPQDLSAVARERAYERMSGTGRESEGFVGGDQGEAAAGDGGAAAETSGGGAPAIDRAAAIRHAADAIQRGADPDAVHARLVEMAPGEQEAPSPFSDLIPKGRQGSGIVTGASTAPSNERLRVLEDTTKTSGSLDRIVGAAGGPASLQRRSDPRTAPQKIGPDRKFSQSKAGDTPVDRDGIIGRAIEDINNQMFRLIQPPTPTLTPAMRSLRQENELLLRDPTVRALLDTISFAEGGTRYNTMFGTNRTFDNMDTHPGQIGDRWHGTHQTAAGRYQIELPTFNTLTKSLGPLSMRPHDQDLMAVHLLRTRGGLAALQSGHLASAVSNLARIWAGLPEMVNGQWVGSHYRRQGQTAKSFEEIQAYFNARLAQLRQPASGRSGRQTGPIRD